MWSFSGVSGLGDFPHLQILPSGVQVGQKDVKYENINSWLYFLQLLGLNNYVILPLYISLQYDNINSWLIISLRRKSSKYKLGGCKYNYNISFLFVIFTIIFVQDIRRGRNLVLTCRAAAVNIELVRSIIILTYFDSSNFPRGLENPYTYWDLTI